MRFWLKQSLIALDQLANAVMFGGWADETLSARCYRERRKVAMKVINAIFLDSSHCYSSYMAEKKRLHMPVEIR